MHWHIDYLRDETDLETVWYTHSDERREHEWAGALSRMASSESVRDFGCSDCRCESHLFYFSKRPGIDTFQQYTGDSVMIWNFSKEKE
jgi:Uri superfamily endonuclease